jgi:hypothetical protein
MSVLPEHFKRVRQSEEETALEAILYPESAMRNRESQMSVLPEHFK